MALQGAEAPTRSVLRETRLRIVGANGSLTGYAGGLDVKLRLLQLEGAMLV